MANPGAIIFSNDPRKGTRNIAWQMLKRVTPDYVIPLSFAPIVFATSQPPRRDLWIYAGDRSKSISCLSNRSDHFSPAWAGYRHLDRSSKRKRSYPLDKKCGISCKLVCFLETSKRSSKEARFSRRRRYFCIDNIYALKKFSNRFKIQTRKKYRINEASREGLTLKMEIFDWRKHVKKFNF